MLRGVWLECRTDWRQLLLMHCQDESELRWRYFVSMDNSVNPTPSDEQIGYDPSAVEGKWQQAWQDRATNTTDVSGASDPYYALMMFPYPSAEGLHVGNL